MPGIYCAGIPTIICHPYGALVVLGNNISIHIISLFLHKHRYQYILRNILTSSYKFSLSRNFCIHIFLTGSAMKHSTIHWYQSSWMAAHSWMYSIWRINPCEQVRDIKNSNYPNIFHLLSFLQSSTLLFATLVVNNATSDHISVLVLFLIYSSLSVNE